MHGLRRNESGLNMSFHCFKIFTAFGFLRVFENIMTKAEVDIYEKYDFILQYSTPKVSICNAKSSIV